MARRDAHYAGQHYESDYPDQDAMIHKRCQICGLDIVINNWPDKKSRTPKYKGFIVCPDCDPRHPADRYMKEGHRVLHRRRARIIALAQVTSAASKQFCRAGGGKADCRCFTCAARKLFPEV